MWLCLLLITSPSGRANPPVPARAEILKTLQPQHPRLLATLDDFTRVRQLVADDPSAKALHALLRARGTALLAQPPQARVLVGPRLLFASREVLDRVYTLALLYRLDGERQWADRAIAEMESAAAFSDWNPSHWLDVAEMTHALAIGYDWLYDVLTPAQRTVIKTALLEKGLREAKLCYDKRAAWTTSSANWNNVCNGGIITGALALADEEPELAAELLARALASLPAAMKSYGPDGAWAEGPGYWGYATKYTVVGIAALQSALGTDFGLTAYPGFSETGLFRLQCEGPSGKLFDFADGSAFAPPEADLFWLARQFKQPLYAYAACRQWDKRAQQAEKQGDLARALLWRQRNDDEQTLHAQPRDVRYTAINLACFRSSWSDPRALYLGFKAGDNKVSHSHLDLGSFILDADGTRWATDLGGDDYDLPDYFGSKRWSYYRLRTEGHNTLLINGLNQDPKAVAPFIAFKSTAESAFAVADLTAAYAPAGVTDARRGIALLPGRRAVLVQDEVTATRPVDIVWQMHTSAQVTVHGRRATLTQDGAVLELEVVAPLNVAISVEEVRPAPPQRPLKNVRKILIRLPGKRGQAQMAVLLYPGSQPRPLPGLIPLQEWELAQTYRWAGARLLFSRFSSLWSKSL